MKNQRHKTLNLCSLLPLSFLIAQAVQCEETFSPFESFQWAFRSSSGYFFREQSDVKKIKFLSHPDAHLGMQNLKDSHLARKTVVAVIDSGVDLDHEELVNQIAYNEVECEENHRLPIATKAEDRDKNQFKGDCAGWNFVETQNKEGNNRPYDDQGHGTHIAGIIAAQNSNQTGIRSFSDSIKILPIKVTSKQDFGAPQNLLSFSERLSSAIHYAIKQKVDVINLSLGWPTFVNNEALRLALEEAAKENIIIVAAAGNNGHSFPLFPCNLSSVLCIGSHGQDLEISHFSNFGNSVDFYAPGENILSTFPKKIDSEIFTQNGYEVKSGSSQSAAYVSGLLAFLISENLVPKNELPFLLKEFQSQKRHKIPVLSAQALVELYSDLKKDPNRKLHSWGDWKALSYKIVKLDLDDESKFSLDLEVSLISSAKDIGVHFALESESQKSRPHLTVAEPAITEMGELANRKLFRISRKIQTKLAAQELQTRITFQVEFEDQSFRETLRLKKDHSLWTSESKSYESLSSSSSLSLRSYLTHKLGGRHFYYQSINNESGLQFRTYELTNQESLQKTFELELKNAKQVNIALNYSESLKLLQFLGTDPQTETLSMNYTWVKNNDPLSFQNFSQINEGVFAPSQNQWAWLSKLSNNIPNFSFMSFGKALGDKSSLSESEKKQEQQFFYTTVWDLKNSKLSFVIIDTKDLRRKLLKQVLAHPTDRLEAFAMVPQSSNDLNNSRAQLIFKKISSFEEDTFYQATLNSDLGIVNFKKLFQSKPCLLSDADSLHQILDLKSGDQKSSIAFARTQDAGTLLSVCALKRHHNGEFTEHRTFKLIQKNPFDPIFALLGISYNQKNEFHFLSASKYSLSSFSQDGKLKDERSLERYSFFPGTLFQESLLVFPASSEKAHIFLDQSLTQGAGMQNLDWNSEGIFRSSFDQSLSIGKNCKTMNPISRNTFERHFAANCFENNSWQLRIFKNPNN